MSTLPITIHFGGVAPFRDGGQPTTCYGIYVPETSDNVSIGIIIDNGTGIHNVLRFMKEKKPERTIQLQTHLHLDHLMGLRFNRLLFTPGGITHCLVPEVMLDEMCALVRRPFHPVDMIPAPTEKHEEIFDAYGVKIEPYTLPHPPDYSTGFRITTLGKTFVVATDCELAAEEDQQNFAEWSKNAGLIILDMEYSDHNYKKGFGHNCPSLVIETLKKRASIGGKNAVLLLVHRDRNDLTRLDSIYSVSASAEDQSIINEVRKDCNIEGAWWAHANSEQAF